MHLFLSAGEISGDRYGAGLIRQLREIIPSARFSGLGGTAMAAAGMERVAHLEDISVMGFTDIPARLPRLLKTRKRLNRHISETRPDAIVFIDFPDFHLSLARSVQRRLKDIPMYYVIPPQVWMWRTGRVVLLRQLFRAVFPIFRFEHEFLLSRGVPSRFLGHPIADFIKYPQKTLEMQPGQQVGLLPGSRLAEIRAILPVMLESVHAVSRLTGRAVDVRIGIADELHEPLVHRILEKRSYPLLNAVVDRDVGLTAARSHVVIAKSGTNNLELAAYGVPFVVVYVTSMINYLIGRYVVKPRFISLVNILSGRSVVPEFIQHEANPHRIAKEVVELLTDADRRNLMTRSLADVWNTIATDSKTPVLRAIAESIVNDLHSPERGK